MGENGYQVVGFRCPFSIFMFSDYNSLLWDFVSSERFPINYTTKIGGISSWKNYKITDFSKIAIINFNIKNWLSGILVKIFFNFFLKKYIKFKWNFFFFYLEMVGRTPFEQGCIFCRCYNTTAIFSKKGLWNRLIFNHPFRICNSKRTIYIFYL